MKKPTFLVIAMLFTANSLFAQDLKTKPVIDLDSLAAALTQQVDSNQIRTYMQGLEDFGSRFLLNENHHDVAIWIGERFGEMGYTQTELHGYEHVFSQFGEIWTTTQYNVIAYLPGISNSTVIVGAHYDAMKWAMESIDDPAPGADDNASGTAGVLELARLFKENNVQPYYTIAFIAFAAEEQKSGPTFRDGAQAFADRMVEEGKHVQYMINLDMIANDDIKINGLSVNRAYLDKRNDNWLFGRIEELSTDYTDLTIFYDVLHNANRTDDLPFFNAGFNTMYFAEYDFSPNYHSETDLVANCEAGFAAEVVKLSAACLLEASFRPEIEDELYLYHERNAESVSLHWYRSTSQGVEYVVKYGKEPGEWIETLVTSDTLVEIGSLEKDVEYYFQVTARNNYGFESVPARTEGQLIMAPMDKGILNVNTSKDNLTGVTNDSLNTYYEFLADRFVIESVSIDTASELTMETMKDYSTVIIHNENRDPGFRITNELQYALRDYLQMGGNVLFSLYKPGVVFQGEYTGESRILAQNFLREKMLIDTTFNQPGKVFNFIQNTENLPEIHVDSAKIEIGLLYFVEVFGLADGADVQYFYGSEYDSTSFQGQYHGQPIALTNPGEEKNLFLTSIPLYYLESGPTQQLVHDILRNKLGEYYVDIPEISGGDKAEVKAFPNPVKDWLKLSWDFLYDGRVGLEIYDNQGSQVTTKFYTVKKSDKRISISTGHLPPGVYLYKLSFNDKTTSGKFILK